MRRNERTVDVVRNGLLEARQRGARWRIALQLIEIAAILFLFWRLADLRDENEKLRDMCELRAR